MKKNKLMRKGSKMKFDATEKHSTSTAQKSFFNIISKIGMGALGVLLVILFIIGYAVFSEAATLESQIKTHELQVGRAEKLVVTLKAGIVENKEYQQFLIGKIGELNVFLKTFVGKTPDQRRGEKSAQKAMRSFVQALRSAMNEIIWKEKVINNTIKVGTRYETALDALLIEKALLAMLPTPPTELPENAIVETTFVEIAENPDTYDFHTVAIEGWVREQVGARSPHFAFFTFGRGDEPPLTLVIDTREVKLQGAILGQPFIVIGDFQKTVILDIEVSSRTAPKEHTSGVRFPNARQRVGVENAILVHSLSIDWDKINR